ncbi:hypothetical protein F5887DRAFT_585681 [Amanita rubescens]|nr:hypothetical protein F5887DRAFT_585681 [Amanita rubescens]
MDTSRRKGGLTGGSPWCGAHQRVGSYALYFSALNRITIPLAHNCVYIADDLHIYAYSRTITIRASTARPLLPPSIFPIRHTCPIVALRRRSFECREQDGDLRMRDGDTRIDITNAGGSSPTSFGEYIRLGPRTSFSNNRSTAAVKGKTA